MILQQLGTQVDINCGGIDNLYRHHDYNIAVMESYSGKPYANFYLHGEHLVVAGKPMSKSVGNILYPEDLIDQGYEHKHLRFFLIQKHYRSKLNFTEKTFRAASERLDAFRSSVSDLTASPIAAPAIPQARSRADAIPSVFERHMDDDLSVGDGFDAVHDVLREIAKLTNGRPLDPLTAQSLTANLRSIDTVIGAIFPDTPGTEQR
jgi:cysteinyl-tRNA synthetase